MKLSEIRQWLEKACIIEWIDSGSWNEEENVEPKDMELSTTNTSGILVFANREKVVLEHEKEPSGFNRQTHSVIFTKCIIGISNKRK